MKKIPLTKGKYALVDDEDFKRLSRFTWHVSGNGKYLYAHTSFRFPGLKREVSMHRMLMKAPDGKVIDHINGNGLDNRRKNLRVCMRNENMFNRALSKNNTSGFKGVSWMEEGKKWKVQIVLKKKAIYLGLFSDKMEAARAYDEAAKKYFGQFARLNLK